MFDIVLAVVSAVSQAAAASMGIWVSSRERSRRIPLAIVFLALAVAGICATMWTAARNRDTVAVTTGIEKDTKPKEPRATLRMTKREVTTMGINQIFQVSIGFENSGDRLAAGVSRVEMVNFVLSPYGEEDAFRLLRSELTTANGPGLSVAPTERLVFTIDGPRLQASDFLPRGAAEPQVVRDSRPLLVAGIVRYQADDRSEATAEYCFYAMNPKVLVACSGHNS